MSMKSTQGSFLATPMHPYRTLRSVGAEDNTTDTNLSLVSGQDYDTLAADSDVSSYLIDLLTVFNGNSWSELMLGFIIGSDGANNPANADDFGFDVIGFAHEGGSYSPPTLICNTAAAGASVGTLASSVLIATNTYWASTISLSFSGSRCGPVVYDSGNDRIAWLSLGDLIGFRYLYIPIFGADGAVAGEAPAVGIVGRVF